MQRAALHFFFLAALLAVFGLGGCASRQERPLKSPSSTVEDFLRASRDVCETFVRDRPGVEPDTIPPFQRYVLGKIGPFLSHSADEAFRESFARRLAELPEEGRDPESSIYGVVDAMSTMQYAILWENVEGSTATVMTELKLGEEHGEKMEFVLVLEDGRWVLTFEAFSGGIPLPSKARSY